MVVVDVNTGKFTGQGGNLEETVTRNNLEAAEEIVRQLRLRDLGGIIVIDFIDMVLESNRELVLRRLTECLGRDRTKHQVTEITSLGLVQMTRKRIGQGLLEAFSEVCDHCKGRGVIIHTEPVPERPRNAVAEKVKAVAASTRGAAAAVAAPESATQAESAHAAELDEDLDSAEEILERADIDTDLSAADATVSGIEEELTDGDVDIEVDAQPSPARRRARRGGSRRRSRS
jgi:ribonuclease E